MIIDKHNRKINYLRVSVTDKCNYRCTYCMPAEGIPLKPHSEMLSYESIALIAHEAGKLGFNKIRITGGEPLVKRDIESLFEMIRLTHKYNEITMTTNGALLTKEKAKILKANGLNRITISLDTLNEKKFAALTRCGNINDVFKGIDAAIEAELFPIKINMIIFEDTTKDEIYKMQEFCEKKHISLQTIQQFSLYNKEDSNFHTCDRPLPCTLCNKLRLTADGYLLPCLFSNKEIKVDLNNIEQSIRKAISIKPLHGTSCANRGMSQIGG